MPDAVGGDGTVDDGAASPSGSWWTKLKKFLSPGDVLNDPKYTDSSPQSPLISTLVSIGAIGPDGNFFKRKPDGSIDWNPDFSSAVSTIMWIGIGIVVVVLGLVALQVLSLIPRKR